MSQVKNASSKEILIDLNSDTGKERNSPRLLSSTNFHPNVSRIDASMSERKCDKLDDEDEVSY